MLLRNESEIRSVRALSGRVSTDLIDIAEPQKINWTNSVVFALLHVGAVAALFMFSWQACAVAVFLYWMTTGLGISMGYHRLHTHRSYQVPLALMAPPWRSPKTILLVQFILWRSAMSMRSVLTRTPDCPISTLTGISLAIRNTSVISTEWPRSRSSALHPERRQHL